jgi:hypothetical protein
MAVGYWGGPDSGWRHVDHLNTAMFPPPDIWGLLWEPLPGLHDDIAAMKARTANGDQEAAG